MRFLHFNAIAPVLAFERPEMRNHRSYNSINGWQLALRFWPAGWLVVTYQRHRDEPGGAPSSGARMTIETWALDKFSPCNFAFAKHAMVLEYGKWYKCTGCGMGSNSVDVDNGPQDLFGVPA